MTSKERKEALIQVVDYIAKNQETVVALIEEVYETKQGGFDQEELVKIAKMVMHLAGVSNDDIIELIKLLLTPTLKNLGL